MSLTRPSPPAATSSRGPATTTSRRARASLAPTRSLRRGLRSGAPTTRTPSTTTRRPTSRSAASLPSLPRRRPRAGLPPTMTIVEVYARPATASCASSSTGMRTRCSQPSLSAARLTSARTTWPRFEPTWPAASVFRRLTWRSPPTRAHAGGARASKSTCASSRTTRRRCLPPSSRKPQTRDRGSGRGTSPRPCAPSVPRLG
mmetsp:Transcript_1263/g.3873  ORF Transcript_1263/g.3873 Transcript_1263/m.3873 type:complete len:202 (-) Transcript_1263:432-1037(-)